METSESSQIFLNTSTSSKVWVKGSGTSIVVITPSDNEVLRLPDASFPINMPVITGYSAVVPADVSQFVIASGGF